MATGIWNADSKTSCNVIDNFNAHFPWVYLSFLCLFFLGVTINADADNNFQAFAPNPDAMAEAKEMIQEIRQQAVHIVLFIKYISGKFLNMDNMSKCLASKP